MTWWVSRVNTAETTLMNQSILSIHTHSVNVLTSVKQIYSMSIRTDLILWLSGDVCGLAATDSGMTDSSQVMGSNASVTHVPTIRNRFVCGSNARVGKEQATGEGRKVISGSWWLQRDTTCPRLAPTSTVNPCRARPASLSAGPAGHAEYEWPCNWQTKLCVDTAETVSKRSCSQDSVNANVNH